MASLADLFQPLGDGTLLLEPVGPQHEAGLRAACAQDDPIWQIYPYSFGGDYFDASFALIQTAPTVKAYVIRLDGDVVGMTAWHRGIRWVAVGLAFVSAWAVAQPAPAPQGLSNDAQLRRPRLRRKTSPATSM